MSGRRRFVFCTAAAMGISFISGGAAMAQESTIAFPYEQEAAWDEIALTNDDTVSTGVNVRLQANEDSPVIGCMYHGGAAWIISRGEEWTEVYSGGLTGFVKNEYLVYGEDAKAAAQEQGVEGVATTWDDVKLYSGADGGSDVLDSISYGDSFILTQDEGHWLQVQRGADSTAYVSSDDVSRVLLFDTAVATDEAYVTPEAAGDTVEPVPADGRENGTDPEAEDTWTDGSAEDTWTDSGADETWTDSNAEDMWTDDGTEDTWTDSSADETWTDDGTEDTWTDGSADETWTDSNADETWTDTSDYAASATTGSESYYDPETGIYYDADTGLYYDSGTGILYDAWWNPVNEEIAAPPVFSTDTGDASSDYTEDAADSSTEDSTYSSTEDQSSAGSSDDASLLAALIYCEAGNQSYDGMVAVGAVVMNRVSSPSFPNSIREVIYQSGQFTPASSGWLDSALASGVPSTCYDAAVAAMNGENPIGSALYFNTGSGKGTKLGDHQFY